MSRNWTAPAPKPESKLARYRVLSPTAAVKVSPLCLGAMNLGTAWEEMMGTMDKKTGFELLDAFFDAGGNFIDTANNYQCEESEKWIGEWLEKRQNRSQMVIATKYSTCVKMLQDLPGPHVTYTGNNAKSLHESVRMSLEKLKTDYIDLLYLHWWDYSTGIEEVMQSLNTLVQQGKVLYLGVSDTPAWVVSKANQYARDHGLRPFSVYQGRWSAADRDFERDILPMCRDERMGICPWGALGGGHFKTKAQREEMEKAGDKGRTMRPGTERDANVTDALEKVAKQRNLSITGIALAYVMQKQPYVFPIVGGRKVSHLQDNIKAIGVELTEEELKTIEDAYPFEMGFPHNMIGGDHPSQNFLTMLAGYFDFVDHQKPIHF